MAYATWNPSDKGAGVTLSNGNLTAAIVFFSVNSVRSTLSKTSGKWYWEVTIGADIDLAAGVLNGSANIANYLASDNNGLSISSNGNISKNGSIVGTSNSFVTGSKVCIAYDAGAGTVGFRVNNGAFTTISGANVPTGALYAAVGGVGAGGGISTTNFGETAFAYTPPSGYIGLDDGVPSATSAATLPSIVAYADDGPRSQVTLPSIVAFMFDQNSSRVTLPSIIADTVGVTPNRGISEVTLPSIIANTSGAVEVPDVGAASFLAMTAAANDDTFGTAIVSFAPMTAFATERALPSFAAMTATGNDNKHATGASAFAPLTAVGYGAGEPSFVAMTAVGSDEGIGSGSALFMAMGASASEPGRPSFEPMTAMVSERGLPAFIALLALASDVGDTYPGWIINYETGAPSRYEGLRANSFCQINGITYIANEDGIYAFGADDDAGVPIQAEIMLPTTDYDSGKNKRIPDVWLGLRSAREMRLKVFTNNADVQYYSVEPTNDVMEAVRVKLGLGVEGRYWQFGLTNLDGKDFELESMGFSPIELKRHGR